MLSEDELKQLEAEKNKVENKRNTIKNEIILLNAKIEATIKTIPESNKNDFNLEKFIEHINQTKNIQETEINKIKEQFKNNCSTLTKKKKKHR